MVNEQGISIEKAWDGDNLKFIFRRTVDNRVMNQWYDLVHIATNIQFLDEDDFII
jgi:hypothetical protein